MHLVEDFGVGREDDVFVEGGDGGGVHLELLDVGGLGVV